MNDPTMLYRCPGPHRTDGIDYEYVIVDDSEVEATMAKGWYRHYTDASQALTDAADRLKANEAEQREIEEKLSAVTLKAVHKGRGVWEVQDASGAVVASGLTKEEAQAQAGG